MAPSLLRLPSGSLLRIPKPDPLQTMNHFGGGPQGKGQGTLPQEGRLETLGLPFPQTGSCTLTHSLGRGEGSWGNFLGVL